MAVHVVASVGFGDHVPLSTSCVFPPFVLVVPLFVAKHVNLASTSGVLP